jgi:lipoprotein-anchoring transpeptidase ErfK/SrfK
MSFLHSVTRAFKPKQTPVMRLIRVTGILGLVLVTLSAAVLVSAAPAPSDPVSALRPLKYDPSVCDGTGEAAIANPDAELDDACAAMIEAFPEPVGILDIEQDRKTLGNYSFWKIGPGATPTYDGPGGNVIGEIPAGFNYVNGIDESVEGWLQIEGGRWIQTTNATNNPPSYHHGVRLLNGLQQPFAIVLDLSRIYTSKYPGGEPDQETERFINRYELVNIYDEVYDEEGWHWYMIGPNQWVKQTFVAVFKKTEIPEDVSERWVAVDLYEQTLIAYEGETPVFATLVSSGIPPFDTREGMFEVWARMEADPMSGATGAPEAYALQFVPWVMYFDGGISLHGTYWHDLFGYRQSHGCVNLSVSDARFVYEFFMGSEPDENGERFNSVYVHSSGEYGSGVLRS